MELPSERHAFDSAPRKKQLPRRAFDSDSGIGKRDNRSHIAGLCASAQNQRINNNLGSNIHAPIVPPYSGASACLRKKLLEGKRLEINEPFLRTISPAATSNR